jgi:hypothetical protein
MIAFSPGIAQGCFELLDIVGRRRMLMSNISKEFSRLGCMPSGKVVETAQAMNWLSCDEDGLALLTIAGQRVVLSQGYESRLRQSLLDYIDIVRPSWLQNASFGRARVIAFAGNDIGQVIVEAGLAHGIERSVVEFWDEMATRARGQKAARLNNIGREGERLTLEYERARTGREPKWVSIDSNADGYDILSVAGPSDGRLLSIEVKATSIGVAGSLHLTVVEWDRAMTSDLHAFHLWDMSRREPRLTIVCADEVAKHIPSNSGEGEWESVQIPYKAFSGR